MSARSRKKKTGNARSNYVQEFSAEDLKQYLLHRQNFYDSDEDLRQDFDNSDKVYSNEHSDSSGYNSYDSREYYDMHCDDCD